MEPTQKSLPQRKITIHFSSDMKELRGWLAELEARMAENPKIMTALQESERDYRILLDDSSAPIFTFYPNGQYRYVNKAFTDGVGRRLNEIIGKKRSWTFFQRAAVQACPSVGQEAQNTAT